ncbi:MAG: FkbM family methyltransferase [Actinobacteria bacterium]|nr:FkbM family methyltransferase [Actinomycetota bacterium]
MTDSTLGRVLRAAPGLEEELAILGRFVGPGAVCVDIGASYGTYTVPLARLTAPGGWVHAFEPRRRSRAVLWSAVRALTPGNVSIHDIGLSDHSGTDTIVTPRRRWFLPVPGRTFLKGTLEDGYYEGFLDEFVGASEHHVEVTTLDQLVDEGLVARADLVKIDVEGAELRVCAGAEHTLERFSPVVICEIEDRHTRKYGHRADDVLAWFRARGYRPHVLADGALRPVTTVSDEQRNHLMLPSGD